jgi:hypothetical protein
MNEYAVTCRVKGEIVYRVEADDEDDARDRAEGEGDVVAEYTEIVSKGTVDAWGCGVGVRAPVTRR